MLPIPDHQLLKVSLAVFPLTLMKASPIAFTHPPHNLWSHSEKGSVSLRGWVNGLMNGWMSNLKSGECLEIGLHSGTQKRKPVEERSNRPVTVSLVSSSLGGTCLAIA